VNEQQRQRRGDTFGQAAEAYDRVRPDYPQALVDHLLAQARIGATSRILEIGCATGQLTRALSHSKAALIGLEPSSELATLAARNFADAPQVQIIEERFEDYAIGGHFDLVVAATSFHWLEPQVRCSKAAAALREGGTLAVLTNAHPTPYTGFFARVQEVYERIVPQTTRNEDHSSSETERWGLAISDELLSSGFFVDPFVIDESWSHHMSSSDYIGLLSTFSDHRLLPDNTRAALFAAQRKIIDTEYGGYVERPYRSILCMAQRNAVH